MEKKTISIVVRILVGLILIALLVWQVSVESIVDAFAGFQLVYLPLIVLLYLPGYILGAANISLLLRASKKPVRFLRLFSAYMASRTVGLLLPSKIGELSLVYFLKQEDVPPGTGLAIVIIDKIITLGILLVFAAGALFIFDRHIGTTRALVLVVLGASLFLFAIWSRRCREFVSRKVLGKYSSSFSGFFLAFRDICVHHPGTIIADSILTILQWFNSFVLLAVLFSAFGVTVSLWYVAPIAALTRVLSLVPITLSGLGVREVLAVFFFGLVGVPGEVVLSAHLILLVLTYLTALLVVFFVDISVHLKDFKAA